MQIYKAPSNWKQVEETDFEQFLNTCADYTADSYSGARCYSFRHNHDRFAMILQDRVYVDPKILVDAA